MMIDSDIKKQLNQKITLKVALYFMKTAWNDVSFKTIKNCWKLIGLIPAQNEKVKFSDENDEDIEFICNAIKKLNIENCHPADEYINIDNDSKIFEEFEKNEIIVVVSHGLADDSSENMPS